MVPLALSSAEDRARGQAGQEGGGDGSTGCPELLTRSCREKKKEAYKSLIFKWAPASPTNTQLPLAGRGHVIKKNLHTDEFFP